MMSILEFVLICYTGGGYICRDFYGLFWVIGGDVVTIMGGYSIEAGFLILVFEVGFLFP